MYDDSLSLYSVPSTLAILFHLILQLSYEVFTTIPFEKARKWRNRMVKEIARDHLVNVKVIYESG